MPDPEWMAKLRGRHIVVEGPVGVGKTSFAERIARRLGASVRLEEVEQNPFLADYYQEMGRMAFQTQMFFLLSRYRQWQDLRQTDLFQRTVITDYLFEKDRVFAALALTEQEFALYDRIYTMLSAHLRGPDLTIFLQAPTDTLVQRVKTRGRPFEKNIEPEYLDAVNRAFLRFIHQYEGSPVLIVDTSQVNLAQRDDEVEDVLKALARMSGGKNFYAPASRSDEDGE